VSRRSAPLLGATVVVAVLAAAIAARHASPAEVSPVVPRGHWNAVWIAALIAGLAAYAIALLVVRTGLVTAVAIAAAVQLIPLAAPLLLSKDAYLYWAEARTVLVHHASPYRSTPNDFPADPATPYVSEEWRVERAPYGPTWEVLALAPSAAAGTSRPHAAFAYKLFGALGVLLTLALVAASTNNAAAVALVGWNPLVALHFAGGGHSDGWLVALLCLGVVARRSERGGAAWALAGAFKPVGGVLLPLDLAADRLRRPWRFWLGLVGAAVAVLAASAAAWGTGWIRASLIGVHGASPLGGVHWLTQAGLSHHDAVGVGAAVFAVLYALLLVRAWRTGRAGLSLAASALCLTTSLLRPWYGIWPLALAAIEEDAWGGAAVAVALSAYLLLGDAVSL
jgi:hypothetical protein